MSGLFATPPLRAKLCARPAKGLDWGQLEKFVAQSELANVEFLCAWTWNPRWTVGTKIFA